MFDPRKLAAMLTLVALAVAPLASAEAPAEGARIQAVVVDTQPRPGTGSASLILRINRWSSDEEVARLAAVLKEKGPEALQEELEELDHGWLRIGSSLGYPIAVARSIPTEDGGRMVRVVIDRPIAFLEVARSLRSEDYPLALIEIRFDAEGKGEGTLAAAVKAHFEGTQLVVETFGARPSRVVKASLR